MCATCKHVCFNDVLFSKYCCFGQSLDETPNPSTRLVEHGYRHCFNTVSFGLFERFELRHAILFVIHNSNSGVIFINCQKTVEILKKLQFIHKIHLVLHATISTANLGNFRRMKTGSWYSNFLECKH